MNPPDYYAVLGVGERASPEQIKAAFHRAARQYHPDLNPGTTHLGTRFQAISNAYYILSEPVRRAAYDAQRHGPQVASAPTGSVRQNHVPPSASQGQAGPSQQQSQQASAVPPAGSQQPTHPKRRWQRVLSTLALVLVFVLLAIVVAIAGGSMADGFRAPRGLEISIIGVLLIGLAFLITVIFWRRWMWRHRKMAVILMMIPAVLIFSALPEWMKTPVSRVVDHAGTTTIGQATARSGSVDRPKTPGYARMAIRVASTPTPSPQPTQTPFPTDTVLPSVTPRPIDTPIPDFYPFKPGPGVVFIQNGGGAGANKLDTSIWHVSGSFEVRYRIQPTLSGSFANGGTFTAFISGTTGGFDMVGSQYVGVGAPVAQGTDIERRLDCSGGCAFTINADNVNYSMEVTNNY